MTHSFSLSFVVGRRNPPVHVVSSYIVITAVAVYEGKVCFKRRTMSKSDKEKVLVHGRIGGKKY